MNKRILAVAVGSAITATSTTTFAQPFSSFDPRSMAMGGAGVAVASPATAPFFNPSLLSVTQPSADFAAEVPMLGVRLYDSKELLQGIEDFQSEDLLGLLDRQAASCTPGNCQGTIDTATRLVNDPKVGFPAVSNKEIQGEFGAALVIGIPSTTFGAAFVADSWATFGGIANFTDQATFNALIDDARSCDSATDITALEACARTADFNQDNLTSTVHLQGVVLSGFGVSLSRQFEIRGTPVALGITPKVVKATTVDYVQNVNDASTDTTEVKGSDYITEKTTVNFDVGVAREFKNGWRSGFVVKNVIPQEYDFRYRDADTQQWVKNGSVKLNPQARAGLSYSNGWFTGALDADLTENNPVGFEDETRYISLGAELNAADWAQVRLGYRADTVNSQRSVSSAGIGISPFGLHVDLAVAGNAHELGGAFQLGFRF